MAKILLHLLVMLFFFTGICHGARILFLLAVGSKSHKMSAMPIAEELADRGHQVTVASPFRTSGPKRAHLHEIYLDECAKLIDSLQFNWFAMQKESALSQASTLLFTVTTLLTEGYDGVMNNTDLRKILDEKNADLVVIDAIYNEAFYPIADQLGVPLVLYSAMPGLPWTLRAMGASMDYASVPTEMMDFGNDMNFWQRAINVLSTELFRPVRKLFLIDVAEAHAKKDFPNGRSIEEIERSASLAIVNSHPATFWPRSLPPTIIPIGALHTRPAKPLPSDFRAFADEAEDGFIIFTLGSFVPVSSMPAEILEIFVKVFGRVTPKVVWKWEAELPANLPPNVMMVDWLPQQDLLGHPNARLFITHGGLLGIQEAIYHAVPLLGLPFGNDQKGNVAKARSEGYGLKLDWDKLNEDVLFDAIQRLINEPGFKMNAVRLSNLMRDELMPGRQVAAYWIEHVIRHNGTKHLQLASKNMPFYRKYLLDFALFVMTILGTVLYLSIVTFKRVLRRIFARSAKVKQN